MIDRSVTMKSLIRLIITSFFIIAYVETIANQPPIRPPRRIESSHGFKSTESLEFTADEKNYFLSKLMKINKDSNHECTPQMEEHVMELIRDWKETNEAMKDKTCDSGMKILGRPLTHLSTAVAWREKKSKHFVFNKYFSLVLGLLSSSFCALR